MALVSRRTSSSTSSVIISNVTSQYDLVRRSIPFHKWLIIGNKFYIVNNMDRFCVKCSTLSNDKEIGITVKAMRFIDANWYKNKDCPPNSTLCNHLHTTVPMSPDDFKILCWRMSLWINRVCITFEYLTESLLLSSSFQRMDEISN